jgi:hypothetical protein
MKFVLILLVLALAAGAQPALAPPQLGFINDGANAFRPVLGIAGNFVLGAPVFAGVDNAAYSGSFGLLKTGAAVLVIDNQGQTIASMAAPAGPAAFAFQPNGSPAFAYFASSHLLYRWQGTGFQTLPFDSDLFPAGAVRSIFAPDAAQVGFLVQRMDGLREIRVLIETGQAGFETPLAGVGAPALMLASGELVYAGANGIGIRRPDGSEIHVGAHLPISFSLTQMGEGWVAVSDLLTGAQFALRTTPGREGLFSLPQVSQ